MEDRPDFALSLPDPNRSFMNLENLFQQFHAVYGKPEQSPVVYFAPGRVNLIGEHTDYNGGLVFPCSLQYGTYLLVRETDDGLVSLATTNFTERAAFPANGPFSKQGSLWFNYPLGVMDQFTKRNIPLKGMEMLYSGDIPNGAGLSSSASIEVVTAFALNDQAGSGLSKVELALLSQKAEHEFAGVNCGIMDQFAVAMGEKNHAIFLNCHTLEYKLIPVLIPGYALVVANTSKKRGLADSKYNERVEECHKAVEALKPFYDIERLSDLGYMQFYKYQEQIADEVVRRRARHVISENQRVLNSVSSLLRSDLSQFGALMNASHESLRDNYEVTGKELDTLVEAAQKIPGVIGARMTGAGFGGCTVNLMKADVVNEFITGAGDAYYDKTGLKAEFYVAEIGDGVRRIN
jgi:galactokinase